MNYDLTIKDERRRFVKRANALLAKKRNNVCLLDESNRTPNQNSYIHVLCRILALETGVSEQYAKQIYFKQEANPDIYITVTKDPNTKKTVKFVKSSKEVNITDTAKAITRFIIWAAEELKCKLPQATLNDDGTLTFASEEDAEAFHRAQIETSKLDDSDPV